MNLYRADFFCDLNNAQDTIDMTYFGEVNMSQVKDLIESCINVYGFLEDPTGLIFEHRYDELPNQLFSMMVMYCEDVHENLCRQFILVCADDIEEAEEIADVESWNHILDLTNAYEDLVLAEPEDEPENEETDGADDAD